MPDHLELSGNSILSAICFALGYNCYLIIMWEKGVLDVFKYCYDHIYENDPQPCLSYITNSNGNLGVETKNLFIRLSTNWWEVLTSRDIGKV